MSANLPEEDLSCPVCCEIFQDPVLLPCSHSFCRSCLEHFWKSTVIRSCPVCRRRASKKSPASNRALKNLCEAFLLGRCQGSASGSNILCWRHEEKLKLFCLVDQEPICVVCQASKMHRGHDCSPMEEAALDCKVEFDSATLSRQTVLHCVALCYWFTSTGNKNAVYQVLFDMISVFGQKDHGRLSNNTSCIPLSLWHMCPNVFWENVINS